MLDLLLKSRHIQLLILSTAALALLKWPMNSPHEDRHYSLGVVGQSLEDVAAQCVVEIVSVSNAKGLELPIAQAERYCDCVAVSLLLPLETEEDIEEAAVAILADNEIFQALITLESVTATCANTAASAR